MKNNKLKTNIFNHLSFEERVSIAVPYHNIVDKILVPKLIFASLIIVGRKAQ